MEQVDIDPLQETHFTENFDRRDVLYESPKERIICNIGSVILLLVLLFLWAIVVSLKTLKNILKTFTYIDIIFVNIFFTT